MTNPELFEVMDRFERSALRSLKLSTPEYTLELESGERTAPASVPSPAPAPEAEETGKTINAPLVGTFYAAPAPAQPPFVTAGARVSKGETVCLIEAMKMMSQIAAPCDCVTEEVLKADGQMAAFGDPLFRYTPC